MRSYRIRVASASDTCVVLTLGMALLVYVLCRCWRFRTQPQDKAMFEWKQYSIDETYFGQLGLLMHVVAHLVLGGTLVYACQCKHVLLRCW